MDFLEKLNKVFASWYESLFADTASDIRPKDVLRKIINTMEDNRKEGLDNRIYVPNKYILEIDFSCDEEREYLLAFLDKAELETALRKYMAQNHYYTRGPLDFTIEEVSLPEGEARPEKLKVKCKWDVRPMEKDTSPLVVSGLAEEGSAGLSESYEEEYTVAAADLYDESTVAPPSLLIEGRVGPKREFLLTKPVTIIGRSRRLGNDLVLDWDGMVSKRHAKIALTSEGFTIIDLDSTNGVWVNGEKVVGSNGRLLNNGDTIRLGATELIFKEKGEKHAPDTASIGSVQPRPKLVFDDGSEFLLASQVSIGRSLGSDLRLDHPSVSRRHALISSCGEAYSIVDLGSESGTWVNSVRLAEGSHVNLRQGDLIRIGEVSLRFELD